MIKFPDSEVNVARLSIYINLFLMSYSIFFTALF